jgi:cobalt-zinc-cadmium resistance protein CzcA
VAAEMRNKRFQSEEELVLAAKRFQWCCYSEDPIVPADTTLMLFPVTIDQSMPAGSYSDYYSGLVMEKKAEMNIEKSRFFPTFSIGYNWQNILPMKNLNSWMVGVAFPLYFGPQKSRMRQAKIAMQTAQIEANEGMLQINHKLSELRASLSRLGESLNYYNNSALKEATELIKTADIQLRASETNVSDYIQSLNAAREIQRGYIDVVYQYNVAALEYELYKN